MSGGVEVVVFPQIAGVQWSDTVVSTLWGMATCVAVVLDIVLGAAKIAPVVLPAPASGMVAAYQVYCPPDMAFRGPCRLGSCMLQR